MSSRSFFCCIADRNHHFVITYWFVLCLLEMMFLETSALTGENVEEAFLKCARSILNKIELGKNELRVILTRNILFYVIPYIRGRPFLVHVKRLRLRCRRWLLVVNIQIFSNVFLSFGMLIQAMWPIWIKRKYS